MCYEKGYGIKKDIPKALELYEKSVELGNKDACFSIARIYEKGENIKMDLSKAILWYKRGYEKGMPIVHAIWLHAIIKEKV